MIAKTVLCIFALILSSFSFASFAGCSTSGATFQNIGTFSSAQVSNQSLDITFSSTLACDGFVNVADYSRLDATLLGANFNLSSNTGEFVPYNLYTDSNYSHPFLLGDTVEFGSFNLIDLLGLFSNVDGTLPLFLRTLPANVSAGHYQDTITILWEWDYCTGVSVLFICIGRANGSEVVNITVELTVEETCELTSQDADFGIISELNTPHRTDLLTEISCTKNLSYSIYVDAGDNFHDGLRSMTNGQNHIAYMLFDSSSHSPVGPSQHHSLTFQGTGMPQFLTIIAETDVVQAFPPPGFYSDTVRVILNF